MNKTIIKCVFNSADSAQAFMKFIEHIKENKEISPLILGVTTKIICEEMEIKED